MLVVDDSGVLADRGATAMRADRVFDRLLADASPSPRSMRAGPEYRLAMLRVLGRRGPLARRSRDAPGDREVPA